MSVGRTKDEVVYIVDDDPQMRETLKLLLESANVRAEAFASAEDFFAELDRFGGKPECLIVDLCLPGMDGVQLQERLVEEQIDIPVIMITAFGDVPTAVKSMKLGAVTFLDKPFKRADLLRQIRIALEQSWKRMDDERHTQEASERLAMLTERERETLVLMVTGKATKQIAMQFGISVKTVAKHQARVLTKMDVDNVVELVHLMDGVCKPALQYPNTDA